MRADDRCVPDEPLLRDLLQHRRLAAYGESTETFGLVNADLRLANLIIDGDRLQSSTSTIAASAGIFMTSPPRSASWSMSLTSRHCLRRDRRLPHRRAALRGGRRHHSDLHPDFKGEFKLGNGRYCYPLTVTDQASRMLLACEALETTKEDGVFRAFQRLFAERGLPNAIRSDNGLPFASPNGLYNLSKLSVWWLRLGIVLERIRPGRPQQNGRHERMHLTLKKEATRPPGMNSLQQQARFDDFLKEFNTERPHEALAMKAPDELYTLSTKPYAGLPDVDYPFHDKDILVTACGRICMHRKKVNISTVMAGQRLGIKEVDEGIWIVSFMHYDLRYIDLEQKTLQTIDNPFGTRLSPMS